MALPFMNGLKKMISHLLLLQKFKIIHLEFTPQVQQYIRSVVAAFCHTWLPCPFLFECTSIIPRKSYFQCLTPVMRCVQLCLTRCTLLSSNSVINIVDPKLTCRHKIRSRTTWLEAIKIYLYWSKDRHLLTVFSVSWPYLSDHQKCICLDCWPRTGKLIPFLSIGL